MIDGVYSKVREDKTEIFSKKGYFGQAFTATECISSNFVTLHGMAMDVIEEHPTKAFEEIELTPSGMTIDLRLLQL